MQKLRHNHFIFLFLLFSCSGKDFRRDSFTVKEILSGNRFKLINGYIVNLIGVRDSPSATEYLKENLMNKKVKFVFDSSSPLYKVHRDAGEKTIYAYVVFDKICLNTYLLYNKLSTVEFQPYLHDSLESYSKYSDIEGLTLKDSDFKPDTISVERELTQEELFNMWANRELVKLRQACDFMNIETRNYAVKVAGQHSGKFSTDQIIDIYDAVRPPNWKYVEDPRRNEFYSSASNTITETNFTGDCDDFAILLYSLITAIGGEARISFAWIQLQDSEEYFGHAFSEVNISTIPPDIFFNSMAKRFNEFSIDSLNYTIEEDGVWLNLDWWAAYPGGKYMDYSTRVIFYPHDEKYYTQIKGMN